MQYSPKQVRVFARPDAGSQPGRINIAWVLTVVGCFAALLYATPAEAQATRTWVSGIGDDANPCSRTAACKTFAGAISKTAPGGEINCLDPGGFGAVTITKPITISCEAGTAGVLVSGTNAIVVAAGSQDRVVLRGLDINGVGGQGLSGIRFLSGAALSFARAIGEFGSIVLISGNLPNKTEVASVYVFGQIESDNVTGAAAVSTLLLVITLGLLGVIALISARRSRHER